MAQEHERKCGVLTTKDFWQAVRLYILLHEIFAIVNSIVCVYQLVTVVVTDFNNIVHCVLLQVEHKEVTRHPVDDGGHRKLPNLFL